MATNSPTIGDRVKSFFLSIRKKSTSMAEDSSNFHADDLLRLELSSSTPTSHSPAFSNVPVVEKISTVPQSPPTPPPPPAAAESNSLRIRPPTLNPLVNLKHVQPFEHAERPRFRVRQSSVPMQQRGESPSPGSGLSPPRTTSQPPPPRKNQSHTESPLPTTYIWDGWEQPELVRSTERPEAKVQVPRPSVQPNESSNLPDGVLFTPVQEPYIMGTRYVPGSNRPAIHIPRMYEQPHSQYDSRQHPVAGTYPRRFSYSENAERGYYVPPQNYPMSPTFANSSATYHNLPPSTPILYYYPQCGRYLQSNSPLVGSDGTYRYSHSLDRKRLRGKARRVGKRSHLADSGFVGYPTGHFESRNPVFDGSPVIDYEEYNLTSEMPRWDLMESSPPTKPVAIRRNNEKQTEVGDITMEPPYPSGWGERPHDLLQPLTPIRCSVTRPRELQMDPWTAETALSPETVTTKSEVHENMTSFTMEPRHPSGWRERPHDLLQPLTPISCSVTRPREIQTDPLDAKTAATKREVHENVMPFTSDVVRSMNRLTFKIGRKESDGGVPTPTLKYIESISSSAAQKKDTSESHVNGQKKHSVKELVNMYSNLVGSPGPRTTTTTTTATAATASRAV